MLHPFSLALYIFKGHDGLCNCVSIDVDAVSLINEARAQAAEALLQAQLALPDPWEDDDYDPFAPGPVSYDDDDHWPSLDYFIPNASLLY